MKHNNIDKQLGSKLRGYQDTPPADLFARIEKSLLDAPSGASVREGGAMEPVRGGVSEPGYFHRKISWLKVSGYAGAAAVVMFALTIGSLYLLKDTSEGDAGQLQVAENAVDAQSDEIIDKADVQAGETDIIPGTQLYGRRGAAAVRGNSKGLIPDQTDYATAAGQLFQNKGQALTPQTGAAVKGSYSREDQDAAQKFWEEFLINESRRGTSRHDKGIGTDLYAGNAGLTVGDASTTDMRKIAASNMIIRERTVSNMVAAAPAYSQYEGLLTHRMPVTFGLGVSYPLTDRMTLHSGLNYTLLVSEATLSQQNNYSIEQRMHYIGIPLGISYSFIPKGKWDVYVRGGGMVERAVASNFKLTTYTDSGSSTEDGRMKIKGVQLSVNCAVGVLYRITNHLGVYVEPGVSYYFDNNQPASYRSEHPTSFTLQAGLRFNLKR